MLSWNNGDSEESIQNAGRLEQQKHTQDDVKLPSNGV